MNGACYFECVEHCCRENALRKPMNHIDFVPLSPRLPGPPRWVMYFWRCCSLVVFGVVHCCFFNEFKSPGHAQDLRQRAEEKFGKDSRIWFSEPGDKSLARWDPPELFEDLGIILEWNAKNLVLLRPEAKRETTISGDFVVRIEPSWTEPGEKIHRLFEQRQFPLVLTQGSEAIKQGKMPQLQQLLILADMVESQSAIGKPHLAGRLFVSLAKVNPPQLLLATIPLPWGNESMQSDLPNVQPLAENWLIDANESLQLLGAAWLLSGQKRSIAIESLENLANSKSSLVSAYAKAQLWRTVPPAEILSDRYPKWLGERDRLLLPIQAGPTMLLAERLAQAGQPVLAISEWLRIATLHGDRYHLATKAISKAADAFRSLGRSEEADNAELMLKRYDSKKP